ncbi:MAG: AAA family ATPase [Muribaculaceae bacterium]|nr:AAA family ATPase [Muribaculaceae bacterium]
MSILHDGQTIEKYRVVYLIKANAYCETYRIEDEGGTPYFLKLYIIKNTPERLLDEHGEVREIVNCRKIVHQNIISRVSDGTLALDEGTCQYMITVYFSGELLANKVKQAGRLTQDEALDIFKGILHGLQYLHHMGLMHNDVTPYNIMLSQKTGGIPELIDMGHVGPACGGNPQFDSSDLDLRYCATSTFAGLYNERSDIFAAFAVLYAMLSGKAPWTPQGYDHNAARNDKIKAVKAARQKELDLDIEGLEDGVKKMLLKGLTAMGKERYENVGQVLMDLGNPNDVEEPTRRSDAGSRTSSRSEDEGDNDAASTQAGVEIKRGGGNGFADIAGMQELKELLRTRVIFVLKDKERSAKYKLTPPNGMLLYGPPGCGKSFFAEKFAEETGFNFILVKASDLGSIYIHGTQSKIADLFKKAEKSAPTVLCFDEFDAFVPSRSGWHGEHQGGEVNEFLSQLNNCSKRGIFVIATSNRPDKIDPAVLRTGRIDKMVFVPMPDKTARCEMFALYLKDRPCAEGIDCDKLADISEGYVASDIAYVVNEAAMRAAINDNDITQELMEDTIGHTNPSVRSELLKEYDEMRAKMENIDHRNSIGRIGFK